MRALRFVFGVALALVAASTAAALPIVPVAVPRVVLQDYSHLYGWIIADRRLGDPHDAGLLQELQSRSRVEHFRDRAASPVAVIKVEGLNADGTSSTRSKYGDYPFYVVRETRKGLLLMGRMFGSSYRSTVIGGKLEFLVNLHPNASHSVKMRFRVDDGMLVNLTPQGHDKDAYIAAAARQ